MTDASDRGSGEVLGLVLVVPVALAVALLVLLLGRHVDARAQVRAAAEAGAQAAAQERTAAAAHEAARRVVGTMLVDATTCREGLDVELDAAALHPGGSVAVTVRCTPSSVGLEAVAPSARTYESTAVAVVDVHRAPVLP